jgi:Ni,Fe-hydrogenase III large subunit
MIEVETLAAYIRTIIAELERLHSHTPGSSGRGVR